MGSQRNRVVTTTLFAAFVVITLLVTTVRPTPPVDLAVYLRAARMFATGGGLYDNGWGGALAVPLPYTYPPVWAGLLSPVGWLPWRIASPAWTALNIALLAWIVHLCYRPFLDRKGEARSAWFVMIVIVAALTTPIASVFWFGQLGIVLAAVCLADVVPARPRLPRGVLVGFATALKLTPGLFAVYWLATKRWRPALVAAATSLGLWLAAAVVRPDLSRQFWTGAVRMVGTVAVGLPRRGRALHRSGPGSRRAHGRRRARGGDDHRDHRPARLSDLVDPPWRVDRPGGGGAARGRTRDLATGVRGRGPRRLRAATSRLGRRRPTRGRTFPHASFGERVHVGLRPATGLPAGPNPCARSLSGGRVLGSRVARDPAVLVLVQPP
ncbi:MAG: DUF2029 domain-containing protein [Actinobacteria bacterium]|nr:MAG: DUF2029 domain-containing protein [Actinomycetota bacterium]